MLKKSIYWLLPLTASTCSFADSASKDPRHDSLYEPYFPSKTYFLMAVDNEISSNIRDQDVGALIGIPDIKPDEADTIYFGMRKAMLKYASRAWDAGLAATYGKDVGRMIGWHQPNVDSDPNEIRIVNKLLLFRYAQQYRSSNLLIQQFHQELSQKAASSELTLSSRCKQQESYSDYIFYKQLGQLSVNPNQLFPIAANYESLFSCNKVRVESMLSAKTDTISRHDIASMVNVADQS